MKKLFINSNNKLRNNRGFTMVEIMVTVLLLSLLFSLVNASVMDMERAAAADDVDTSTDNLYTIVNNVLVNHPNIDDVIDELTNSGASTWRGFNPTYSGSFDVLYMVDYQNSTAEAPDTIIDYGPSGIDVLEGYQVTDLVDLLPYEEGFIWAYGILYEYSTKSAIEVTLVKVPYDNTGTAAQTATNAQLAAKIASSIIGTGVRDPYQGFISYSYTNPETNVTEYPTIGLPVYGVFDNPYGYTHLFDRNNMMCTISSDMLYSRYRYCAWTIDTTVLHGVGVDLDEYLANFNRDIYSSLSYYGADS